MSAPPYLTVSSTSEALYASDWARDPTSYYQISGIHGEPHVPWNGATAQKSGSYCQHGSVLFPTWHRSYLLLFEVRDTPIRARTADVSFLCSKQFSSVQPRLLSLTLSTRMRGSKRLLIFANHTGIGLAPRDLFRLKKLYPCSKSKSSNPMAPKPQ
jgi:hypothetical protein